MPASGLFISYRRSDSQHAAGRLADALSREFGDERIFRDIEDIEAGADFIETLDKALAGCAVMLVVIGPQWLDLRDPQGRRRLEQPQDWVRQEIARALQRGIRVVPVLLERVDMPGDDSLPDDLKALSRRQALRLADDQWARDVAALIAALRPLLGNAPAKAAGPAAAPLDAVADVTARIGSGVRTGLTWAMRLLLGLGLLMALLVFLLVRACSSETPDLTGRWTSAEGWTLDFQPIKKEGQDAYRVAGRTPAGGEIACEAAPGMFGSADLACSIAVGANQTDSFTCGGLFISGTPLTASGDCKWQRDGSTRKLSIKR
jgi:TIR domain